MLTTWTKNCIIVVDLSLENIQKGGERICIDIHALLTISDILSMENHDLGRSNDTLLETLN